MAHSTKIDGKPGWYFFPNDWLASADLGACSLAAQGLWLRLLCFMFVSPKRGVLLQSNGHKMDNKILAKLCGETEQVISSLIGELEVMGVISFFEGSISNRRMLRDEEVSHLRSEAGIKGMSKRWGKKYNKTITRCNNKGVTGSDKDKDIVNSNKVVNTVKIKYLKFVYLLPEEHDKLIVDYGKSQTEDLISRLNDYIGSKGDKYKSHYFTLLNFARRDNIKKITPVIKKDIPPTPPIVPLTPEEEKERTRKMNEAMAAAGIKIGHKKEVEASK